MSLRQTNLLIFFSFFPVFVFKSNLVNAEIFSSIIVFTLPILLINIFFIKKNILNDSFLKIYYSLIIVFGIDNNIGLWNGVISPFKYFLMDIFNIIYIPGFILLIILTLFIFIVISRTDKKFYNVILIFLSVIFVFKIFDQTKSYKNIPSFVKKINNNYKKTELVIILDEMSGINSFESLSSDGIEFNILAKKFFKKYNFEFYTNAKTIEANTVSSLSALLNYSNTSKTRIETTNISTNYFIGYNLTESLFFKRFKNISIFQSEHLNFCNFENISKCDAYNPFNENEYLKGYKDTALTKIVSLWKINGSISSTFVWRLFREFRIIDSSLEPEGHKATFQHLFEKIENLEENISDSSELNALSNNSGKEIIIDNKEHRIDKSLMSLQELHTFEENVKIKEKSYFGFYTYLALLIGIIFAVYEILNTSKDLIILKFPISEPYIEYFYEVIEILAYAVMNIVSLIKGLF